MINKYVGVQFSLNYEVDWETLDWSFSLNLLHRVDLKIQGLGGTRFGTRSSVEEE